MQIDDRIRQCVAFLGWQSERGFEACGTAFFVRVTLNEHDFTYLISARHVIWPHRRRNSPTPDGNIMIRINKTSGVPATFTVKRSDWIFHPDRTVDLCAYEFSDAMHNADDSLEYSTLGLATMSLLSETDDLADFGISVPTSKYGLSLGDEVFAVSAFVSHIGTRKNIPVVRIGNIAALPEEPVDYFSPRRPAYLVETRSIGGMSGAPVFLHLYPNRPRGDGRAKAWGPVAVGPADGSAAAKQQLVMPYIVVGVLLGTHGSSVYKDDFVIPESQPGLTDSDLNSGLSVVLPVIEIIRFLYGDEFIRARNASLEHRRHTVGAPRMLGD